MTAQSIPEVSARGAVGRDLVAAALWIVVVVPPSFGFWFVAGGLADVPVGQQRTLVLASLLGCGIATLLQMLAGYRMPVFEGPASTYLAAVAVLSVSASGARPRAVTGGLLAAGALVLILGLLGADRVLRRVFTPPVVVAFLVIVVVTVIPATAAQAIGRSHHHPWGSGVSWVSAAVVLAVGSLSQLFARARSFGLLAALVLGSVTYFAIDGWPAAGPSQWAVPQLFPWGSPLFSASVVAPFAIAALLASFNTIASLNVMGAALEQPVRHGAERRGLLAHGAGQAIGACFGNVLGNVPRMDSVGVVRMLGNARPRALAIAAGAIIGLAFVAPAVDLLAKIPVAVSAALLAVVLGMVVRQGLRQVATFDRSRRWLVFAPAVAPTFVWLLIEGSLSEQVQLLSNPLLVGVLLAIVLDRVVPRSRAPRAEPAVS
jgi:xanthine/uracil permease